MYTTSAALRGQPPVLCQFRWLPNQELIEFPVDRREAALKLGSAELRKKTVHATMHVCRQSQQKLVRSFYSIQTPLPRTKDFQLHTVSVAR